jgi:hypothetical protein
MSVPLCVADVFEAVGAMIDGGGALAIGACSASVIGQAMTIGATAVMQGMLLRGLVLASASDQRDRRCTSPSLQVEDVVFIALY